MIFILLTMGLRFGLVPWESLQIGVVILSVLQLNLATVTQKYQLTDQLGQETSFPLNGGSVEIFCSGKKANKETYLVNSTAEEEGHDGKMKNTKFLLNTGVIGTKYLCFGADSASLAIGPLHCDPFDMIPSERCKENQWCLIAKDGHAMCEDKAFAACFLGKPTDIKDKFESSLLKFRYACTEKKKQSNHEFGSCHAKSEGKKIVGISDQSAGCGFLEPLTVNNAAIAHEETFSISVTEKKWKIQFKGAGDVTCTILDNDNKSYASIKPFKTDTIVQPEFDGMLLPRKLKFSCLKSASSYSNLIAGFALIFDPDPSKYKISISKTLKPTFLELTCSCNVPDGLIGKLTWEKPEISKGLMEFPSKLQNKQLNRKEHASPVEYNCYLQVLAYAYPNTFKLIRLPLDTEHLQASIAIADKDFVTDNGGLKPGGGTNGSGTGENPTENKNKDANSTEKDKDKTKTIVIVSCVVILLLIVAIVCVLIFIMKRKKSNQIKSQQGAEEAAKASAAAAKASAAATDAAIAAAVKAAAAKEHEAAEAAEAAKATLLRNQELQRMQFINSIENSENNVDEAFLGHFYRQKNTIIQQSGGDLAKVLECVKADPDCCVVAEHWELIEKHKPSADARTLPTCRFPDKKFEISSWVFKDVIPPRKSKTGDCVEKESLNMSFVSDIFLEQKYIASQAPLEHEMELFLKAIMQQKVSLVVAVVATGEKRWYDYMAIDVGKFKMYGDSKLSCSAIHRGRDYETRFMSIKHGETKHSIAVIRYLAWPDFGIGEVDHVLILRAAIIRINDERPGRIIHCAAGLGRTGALLGSLLCLQFYDFKGLPMDIAQICLKIRKERIGAIQVFAQFALVYWVVAKYDKDKLKRLAPAELTMRPQSLRPQEKTEAAKRPISKYSGKSVADTKSRSSISKVKKIAATAKSSASK